MFFFFQAEDGIRDLVRSRGLGDVYKRQYPNTLTKVLYANFGSLGNTFDGVVIYDFRNGIIDSLFYRSSWGGKKGYSLERISLTEQTNDSTCLLYTSDAADERSSVDLGGRRIIKKKKKE